MSQVPAGPEGTGTAMAATPAQTPTPAAAPQTPQGNLIQVDRNAFAAFGGDYHKAIEAGKAHQEFLERLGSQYQCQSIEDLMAFVDYHNAAQPETPPETPAAPAVPGEEIVTVAQMRAFHAERDAAREAADKAAKTAEANNAAQQRATAAMQTARDTATTAALATVGFKAGEDGKMPPHSERLEAMFASILDDAMIATIPQWQR